MYQCINISMYKWGGMMSADCKDHESNELEIIRCRLGKKVLVTFDQHPNMRMFVFRFVFYFLSTPTIAFAQQYTLSHIELRNSFHTLAPSLEDMFSSNVSMYQ